MGVKSTVTITRAQAEERYCDRVMQLKANKRRSKHQDMIESLGYIQKPYISGFDLSDIDEEKMIEIFHHVDAQLRQAKWRDQGRREVLIMTDAELEIALERVNDEAMGGEGFENYIISETPRE